MKRLTYKISLLSMAVLIILLTLPVTARADGGEQSTEFTQTVNGYQITLAFEKLPTVGNNQVHIRVNDAQNMSIHNGDVEIHVVKNEADSHAGTHNEMADMPGMADVSEKPAELDPHGEHSQAGITHLTASHHSGEYVGEIMLQTAGDWIIRVHLTVQGKSMDVDFPLEVTQSQNGSGVLVVFFAVNIAIVTVALMLKPKPVSVISSKGA